MIAIVVTAIAALVDIRALGIAPAAFAHFDVHTPRHVMVAGMVVGSATTQMRKHICAGPPCWGQRGRWATGLDSEMRTRPGKANNR